MSHENVFKLSILISIWLLATSGCLEEAGIQTSKSVREVEGLEDCAVKVQGYHYLAALLPYEGAWSIGWELEHPLIQAVMEINDGGGVAKHTLGLVLCDTKDDQLTAEKVMKELVDASPISGVVGTMLSEPMNKVSKIAIKEGIPIVSPAVGAGQLSELDDYGFVNRTISPMAIQGRIAAEVAKKTNLDDVLVIHIDDADANDMWQAFHRSFDSSVSDSYRVSESVSYNRDDPNFASAVIDVGLEKIPQAVFLITYPEHGASIIRTAINRIFRPGKWLFPAWLKSQDFIDNVGDNAFLKNALGVGILNPDREDFRSFADRYQSLWGHMPETYGAHAYDAVYLLAIAMALSSNPDNRLQVRDNLRKTSEGVEIHPRQWKKVLSNRSKGQVDYQGASGPVDLDENGDVISDLEEWKISSGKLVTTNCWTPSAQACE